MRLYIVSGTLLFLPIVDFALAAPVLVQEKRQACADMANIPEYPVTVFGKRGGAEIEEAGGKYIENWFAEQGEKATTRPSSSSPPLASDHDSEWVDVKQPPPITEGLSPESDDELTGVHAPQSSPVLPNWFLADHGYTEPSGHPLAVEEPPSGSTSPTESDDESTGVHSPLSNQVLPNWFLKDHGYMGPSDHPLAVEEPPSRSATPTVSEAEHGYQVVHPPQPPLPPGSASLTAESNYEMVDVPPSSSVSSTKPDRRSVGEDSRNTLKGKAKESRHISGITRDGLNAAQRGLQRVRSLGPEE
jgi:hypothetical protein